MAAVVVERAIAGNRAAAAWKIAGCTAMIFREAISVRVCISIPEMALHEAWEVLVVLVVTVVTASVTVTTIVVTVVAVSFRTPVVVVVSKVATAVV